MGKGENGKTGSKHLKEKVPDIQGTFLNNGG